MFEFLLSMYLKLMFKHIIVNLLKYESIHVVLSYKCIQFIQLLFFFYVMKLIWPLFWVGDFTLFDA